MSQLRERERERGKKDSDGIKRIVEEKEVVSHERGRRTWVVDREERER